MELVYSESCPYCRRIAAAIDALDPGDLVRLTAIESERGDRLVRHHHGQFVHAPHLFTDEVVYFGIKPVARKLAREMPRVAFEGVARRVRSSLGPPRQAAGMATDRDADDCDDEGKSFLEALRDCIGGEKSGAEKRRQ